MAAPNSSINELQYWNGDSQHNRRNLFEPRGFYGRLPNTTHQGSVQNLKSKRKIAPMLNSAKPKQKRESVKPIPMVEHKEVSVWPRVQKRIRVKYPLRSTRMVDVDQLPLQEPLQDEKKQSIDNVGSDKNETLRSFTLKKQLEKFTDEFAGANITLEVLGRTIEYNDIILFKVTEQKYDNDRHFRVDENKYADDVPEKKIVFIVHGLSVMGINNIPCLKKMCKLRTLMSYYFDHLDKFDIFLMPVANPDGYGLAVSGYLFTNKNNSPQSSCSGVALDRNFEVSWNDSGTVNSCSIQYPGPKPFSEPETRAVRDVLHHYSHKIVAYIHVHAGTYDVSTMKGDAVLYPKGYTDVQSEDDKYIDLKGEIDESMKNASFRVLSVTVDTLYNWYGKVTGTSVDYAATIYGIPYALEFVMQPYDSVNPLFEEDETKSTAALEEVWKRIIDVSFNHIYRSLKTNDL